MDDLYDDLRHRFADIKSGKANLVEHELIEVGDDERHNRIWGWFDTVYGPGKEDEYTEQLRLALTEIEQIPGLPENFEVPYIKFKEGRGMVIEYEHAGACNRRVLEICRRLEAETLAIMTATEPIVPPGTPELTPSYHGEDCLGNGEHEGIECCCDECSFYQECFPDWRELHD